MNPVKTKVKAAGVGGAVATLAVFVFGLFGVEVGAEQAGGLATMLSFGLGWLIPD